MLLGSSRLPVRRPLRLDALSQLVARRRCLVASAIVIIGVVVLSLVIVIVVVIVVVVVVVLARPVGTTNGSLDTR